MEKDVGEDTQRAVARRVVVLVAEDGSIDLSLCGLAQNLNLLFGFGGQIGLKGLEVFLDPRRDTLEQAFRLAIVAVSLVLLRHLCAPVSRRSRILSCPHKTSRANPVLSFHIHSYTGR